MIVAEKVQETMKGQDPKLSCVGMPGIGRLTSRNSCGDNDIPKMGRVVAREGKHIGWLVFSAVSPVQRANSGIADERDPYVADRAGRGHGLQPLRQPGSADGTALAVRDGDPHAPTVWIHRTIRTP